MLYVASRPRPQTFQLQKAEYQTFFEESFRILKKDGGFFFCKFHNFEGNYGNRGRGFNRNFQRQNNHGNGYFNQRFNNSFRTDNQNNQGDGNNFQSGNSGYQQQHNITQNNSARGGNQNRGGRGGR